MNDKLGMNDSLKIKLGKDLKYIESKEEAYSWLDSFISKIIVDVKIITMDDRRGILFVLNTDEKIYVLACPEQPNEVEVLMTRLKETL